MKFQRSLREEVNVNLTPLIDVVFLLLIFFMVTTTFSRNTNLLINLPEATGEVTEQQAIEIEILIAENDPTISRILKIISPQKQNGLFVKMR